MCATTALAARGGRSLLRVVLATNVLVSALLVQGSVPDQVARLALAGRFTWLVDSRIVAEYRDVLQRRSFGFAADDVRDILKVVDVYAEWVVANPLRVTLRDESDRAFIEVAVAGGADIIVTGNIADFRLAEGRLDVRVLTPRRFLDALGGRPASR